MFKFRKSDTSISTAGKGTRPTHGMCIAELEWWNEIMEIKKCLRPPFEYIVHLYAQFSGNNGRTWNGEEICELDDEVFSQ